MPQEPSAAPRQPLKSPIALQPFSLGMMWLFEDLKHPFDTGLAPALDENGKPKLDAGGKPVAAPLALRDLARAIYIFSDTIGAAKALANGVSELDAAAMRMAAGISPEQISEISAEIKNLYNRGLTSIPGSGTANQQPAIPVQGAAPANPPVQ